MANDIKMWLSEVGFIQYTDTFIENAVDYDILPQLTAVSYTHLTLPTIYSV